MSTNLGRITQQDIMFSGNAGCSSVHFSSAPETCRFIQLLFPIYYFLAKQSILFLEVFHQKAFKDFILKYMLILLTLSGYIYTGHAN